MIPMLRHSARLSSRTLPAAIYRSSNVVTFSRTLTSSLVLKKKEEKNTSKTDKTPKSILTDDMLFKAGVDVDEGTTAGNSDAGIAEDVLEGAEGEATNSNSITKKKRKRQSSTDIKREKYANWMYIFSFASLTGVGLFLSRDWEENEASELKEGVDNGYTPTLMYHRFKARFNDIFTYFQEPPFPDLLPPPPPAPYQRPLTLVLSLDDLLVHSEWSQKNGWRTAKRPGVDYFLGYLSQYYEIVLFSSTYMMYSEKIAEKLDPIHAFISYNLFKEHCVYKDGTHIKDLSKINRDLSKVIIVDTDENSFKLQPENAIPMKPWEGQNDDEILRLIPFLEYMATQQVGDVRPILSSFKDKHEIPAEFNERVQKLKAKFYNDSKSQGNLFLSILNIAGAPKSQTYSKFPLDMIREEGEKNYVRFMQLIEEEKEKIRIQQEQMSGQTFTLKDYVEGNIPTPEEQLKLQIEKQKEIDAIFEEKKKQKNGETKP